MLYFGDPELVQKHLHEDLNTIIKNVKTREEQHLQLLQYNKAIANKKRSIQNTIFINDEILTHNKFLQKVLEVDKSVGKQQSDLLQKYDQASVKYESVIKLMGRVATRIIQTNNTFIDKIKSYNQIYIEQFVKMKSTLTKLINSKEQIDLGLSIKTIIDYTKNKSVNEIEKLKLLIKSIEDGQIEKIPFIFKRLKAPEPTKIQIKIQKSPQKGLQKKSPIKKQEKHEIINKIKSQIKIQQNVKKQRKNFANKLANMYSTMDLSRKDFIEDIMLAVPKQFDRIYDEILTRNKFNKQQILEFQNKKEEFQERVKIFKLIMIQQSNKIQEVLMIKKPIKIQRKNDAFSESASKIEIISQIQQKNPENTFEESSPPQEFKRAFILRQKAASPRFHKQVQLNQMRNTQAEFNHIKFDASNQEIFLRSNRNRLPSIQNKQQTVSIDNPHRYHITKHKQDKSQARKNFLMKNIQLGVQNVIKQNQTKNQSESKQIAEKMKEIQPTNSSFNNVNLLELTFYGSKKRSLVLGQTKANFAF